MTAKVICVDANFAVRMIIFSTPESPFIVLWEQWQDAGYQKVDIKHKKFGFSAIKPK